MSDEATEQVPGVSDSAEVAEADPQSVPEAGQAAPPTSDEHGPVYSAVRRGCGVLLLMVLVATVGLSLLAGAGTWAAKRKTSTVPSVTGLSVADAVGQIRTADLSTARMGAFANTAFLPDVVMMQSPVHSDRVPPGTPVDLLVAVSPSPTVVPDVSLETTRVATSALEHSLFWPVIYEQLSDTVPFGCVVSQMPRAGQQVMTGQQVVLFVSLGPGTGGAVVPSVLGKSVSEAATDIAGVYLVAVLQPGADPNGTVSDQVPSPGARVPIGSAVPLLTTSSPN